MNRVISSVAALFLAASSLCLSAPEEMPSEVLGPDGKPVEEATFFVVLNSLNEDGQMTHEVKKVDLKDWKKGFRFKMDDFTNGFSYLVIDSSGCAIGIYQYAFGKFKLEKEFRVEGKVIDEAGKPVSDAEISIGRFGLNTYTNIRMNGLGDKLPWVRTKSDKEGKFQLRGGVLLNYGWDVGVEVKARIVRDGTPMIGESVFSFMSDSPFFEEGRKQSHYTGNKTIKLLPRDIISGVVLDTRTGKPIEGAKIRSYGQRIDTASGRHREITTDKEGRFKISDMRIERLGVQHPDYQRGNLIPEENWREAKHHNMEIKLPPLVDSEIKLIDTHTGHSPIVPMLISYEMDPSPAGKGWVLDTGHSGGCATFFGGETLKADSKGIFSGKLPVGDIHLECQMERARSTNSPYSKQFDLTVPFEGDRKFEVSLDRKPGVLFSFKIPKEKPRSAEGKDDWERAVGSIRVVGSPSSTYANQRDKFQFQRVSEWGKEVNVKFTLQRSKPNIEMMDRNYTADPGTWPETVDAVALREQMGELDN